MNDMTLNNIISLSAVCVTLLLGISGLIVNSLIQRKSNSLQIITQCRLERRKRTQEIVSQLLEYSDPQFINMLTDMEKQQTAKETVRLVSEFRILYNFSFDHDIDFVTTAFEMKELLCDYLIQNGRYPAELYEKRASLAELADVYLLAEWNRIKFETVGKQKNRKKLFANWKSLYAESNHNFSQSANKNLFAPTEAQDSGQCQINSAAR